MKSSRSTEEKQPWIRPWSSNRLKISFKASLMSQASEPLLAFIGGKRLSSENISWKTSQVPSFETRRIMRRWPFRATTVWNFLLELPAQPVHEQILFTEEGIIVTGDNQSMAQWGRERWADLVSNRKKRESVSSIKEVPLEFVQGFVILRFYSR